MCGDRILVLFLPLYLNLYTNIIHQYTNQTTLAFTKLLLTHRVSCRIMVAFLRAWIISRFLQQFLAIESFHDFAFLRTDGEGTSPPPCSKLPARAYSTFAVEELPIHFFRVSCTEKRNVEKSSITVSVSVLDETKLMTLFHIF